MIILTRGYGQTDRPTDRPTLLPIELLSQLKRLSYITCELFKCLQGLEFFTRSIDVKGDIFKEFPSCKGMRVN